MEKRLKRVAVIAAITMGALLLFAIVLGVLNALVGDGRWNFGWNDYRYDDEGYETGQGTVPYTAITAIDLDWIDGGVEIVACQDSYLSLSERASAPIPKSAELRWRVDADGKLSIKYRQSDWFFGIGNDNRDKHLVLRIPESYFAQIKEISVKVDSTNVVIRGVSAEALHFTSDTGALVVQDAVFSEISLESEQGKLVTDRLQCNEISAESQKGDVELGFLFCPKALEIDAAYGDVTLTLPSDASFTLAWETKNGRLSHDLPLTQTGNGYVAGQGEASFEVNAKHGDLTVTVSK